MAQSAKVQSIDTLRGFRAALIQFAQAADTALADAEGEMAQALNWLQTQQPSYWRAQLRKRTETLSRAKEALRMKQIFKDSSGRSPSADAEQKAVRLATQRVEEAQQKLQAIKSWERRLQKEIFAYQGTARRLSTQVQSDIPRAVARLDEVVGRLEAYVSLRSAAPAAEETDGADRSMARPPTEGEEQENEAGQAGEDD